MLLRFTHHDSVELHASLSAALKRDGAVELEVPSPEQITTLYDGELIMVGGVRCRYRSWAAWHEWAQVLGGVLLTPSAAADGWVRFGIRRLDERASWHRQALPTGDPEKYGADSEFARIDKLEDPSFLSAWLDAIDFLNVPAGARVLSLGCHTGSELRALKLDAPARLLGVDHSHSAIAVAKARHPEAPFEFEVRDLATDGLPTGVFDLVIAINVLHSPALDGQQLFRRLVKQHLAEDGRVLLGWPNCRYIDHRLVWGAVTRHARGPELSVLVSEVTHHRRYLHQHRFKTQVTGKHTMLLAGRRLRSGSGVQR